MYPLDMYIYMWIVWCMLNNNNIVFHIGWCKYGPTLLYYFLNRQYIPMFLPHILPSMLLLIHASIKIKG